MVFYTNKLTASSLSSYSLVANIAPVSWLRNFCGLLLTESFECLLKLLYRLYARDSTRLEALD
jgi:hypothetical protein